MYSCYMQGVKKHFRTIGLSKNEYSKVEKLLEQTDSKRADVRKFNVKYTKD